MDPNREKSAIRRSVAVLEISRRYQPNHEIRGRGRRFLIAAAFAALLAVAPAARLALADYAEAVHLFRTGNYAECVEAADKAIAEDVVSENNRVLKIRAELEL